MKQLKRIPIRPSKLTSIERKALSKLICKYIDELGAVSYTRYTSSLIDCCIALNQAIEEGL
jgi:hypothetical protein